MAIIYDPIAPVWTEEELEFLGETQGTDIKALAASEMSAGCHYRPYGGLDSDALLLLWEGWHHNVKISEPPSYDTAALLDHDLYPEVALRGLARVRRLLEPLIHSLSDVSVRWVVCRWFPTSQHILTRTPRNV
jgi:hypothetical protein